MSPVEIIGLTVLLTGWLVLIAFFFGDICDLLVYWWQKR